MKDPYKKVFGIDSRPKRHPSEITLEEFIEVAKIFTPTEFWEDSCDWEITHKKGAFVKLSAGTTSYYLLYEHIGTDGIDIEFESLSPLFNQSLKIANYLDQIGIEYRAQNEEA